MTDITAEFLRSVLSYDPDTGVFTRLATSGGREAGTVAGGVSRGRRGGYVKISVMNKQHLAHRLAWLHVNGEWPPGRIDHKDLCKTNNAILNLRIATQSQNCANKGAMKTNTSGLKGVSWHPGAKKWTAQITVDGEHHYIGRFVKKSDARMAYLRVAQQHFGEFAR